VAIATGLSSEKIGAMATFSLPAHPLGDGVVTLRPWTEADLPAIEVATRDPEIVRRNRLPQPFDAAAWFEQSSVEREQGRSVRLLIVDPRTERLLADRLLLVGPVGDQVAYERRSANGR
jgi:hypothetical protein